MLLSKHFNVRVVDFFVSGLAFRDIARSLRNLVFGFFWADVTLSWFAGWHSLVAVLVSRLLGKKSIVIAGGGEVTRIPEIGYAPSRLAAIAVKYSLLKADRILSISEFNRTETQRIAGNRRISLIHIGIDCDKFSPEPPDLASPLIITSLSREGEKKGGSKDLQKAANETLLSREIPKGVKSPREDIVLTVGIIKRSNIKRKGLDTFVKSARYLPRVRFIVAGTCNDGSVSELLSIAPRNVEFTGFLPEQSLIQLYRRAKVYCQLSLHEAFGVALAEAMSCGCVPVVTRHGALPEVVGETGFCAPYGDPSTTASAIETAMTSAKNEDARLRILANFSIERREQELVKEIESLAPSDRQASLGDS